jgi:diguanylate cyclase (GGDEF)-like protein
MSACREEPLSPGPIEIEAVDTGALEEQVVVYEEQLRAERDAERRGRERAEALGRIAMRLANLTAAAQIESALTGELIGGGFVDRAELIAVAPGSTPVDAFFTPQLMADGTTGVLPVLAPSGSAIARLQVETAGQFDEEQQAFLLEAAAVAGQALDRVARAAGASKHAARATTDLPAKRWWNAAIERDVRRARSTGQPFTVVAVELDDFERIATQRGAVEADALLIAVLDAWRQCGHDLLSRHGGEEYAALLSGFGLRQARLLIADVRRVPGLPCTFSTGTAQWDGREDAVQLVNRAEAALAAERRLRALT